jgi:hypothetical protein
MNKILEGAKQALAFVRGEGQAARITTFEGGPYYKGPGKGLLQHRVSNGYIIWNWDAADWDRVKHRVTVSRSPQDTGE